MPKGSHLWKSRSGYGTWHSKLPGFASVSRSWRRRGYHEALRLVIVDCWWLHAILEGLTESELPVVLPTERQLAGEQADSAFPEFGEWIVQKGFYVWTQLPAIAEENPLINLPQPAVAQRTV